MTGVNKRISDLDDGVFPLYGTELFPAVQDGNNVKFTGDQITGLASSDVKFGHNSSFGAPGFWSVGIGRHARANAPLSVALGTYSDASGIYSVALGYGAIALSSDDIAIGHYAYTSTDRNGGNYRNISIGVRAQTYSGYSVAIGYQAKAKGYNGVSIGTNSLTIFDRSVAIGNNTYASETSTIAIGNHVNTTSYGAVGLGSNINANSDYAIAIGYSADATASGSIAIGPYTTSSNQNTVAIGYAARSTQSGAIAIGRHSHGYGLHSAAFGENARAPDQGSLSLGYRSRSYGTSSIAIGDHAITDNLQSIAIGTQSYANGDYAIVIGYNVSTNGNKSIVIGYQAGGASVGGIAIGSYSLTNSEYAIAIGRSHANSPKSIAIGYSNSVNGNYSVSVGNYNNIETATSIVISSVPSSVYAPWTTIIGSLSTINSGSDYSIIIGTNSIVNQNSQYSIAIGKSVTVNEYSNKTIAIGYNAQVVGDNSIVIGREAKNSHAGPYGGNPNGMIVIGGYAYTNAAKYAIALGYKASSYGGIALGPYTNAGKFSIALGYGAQSQGIWSTAIGFQAKATNFNAIAFGVNSESYGADSISIGTGSLSNDADSISIGRNSVTHGYASIALGKGAYSSNDSVAIGQSSYSSNTWAIALGGYANATGVKSIAIGRSATASQFLSVAIGENATSHSEGAVVFGGTSSLVRNSFNVRGDSEVFRDCAVYPTKIEYKVLGTTSPGVGALCTWEESDFRIFITNKTVGVAGNSLTLSVNDYTGTPNQSLVIDDISVPNVISISLATDSGGVITTTMQDLGTAISGMGYHFTWNNGTLSTVLHGTTSPGNDVGIPFSGGVDGVSTFALTTDGDDVYTGTSNNLNHIQFQTNSITQFSGRIIGYHSNITTNVGGDYCSFVMDPIMVIRSNSNVYLFSNSPVFTQESGTTPTESWPVPTFTTDGTLLYLNVYHDGDTNINWLGFFTAETNI